MASPDQRRPGKPTNVRVVPGGTTLADRRSKLTISWRPQPSGNKRINGVQVQYWSFSTKEWITFYDVTTGTIPTSLATKDEKPNTTRRYRVRNRDSDGWGPWSDAKEGTTDKAWAGAPTIGSISAPSPSMVSVSWSAPADNGGSPITGYLVRVWELNPVKYVFETDVTASTRVFTITGLKAAKEHQVNISAANKIERISVYAGIEKITTKAATPPDAPTNLTATADGRTTINISWTAPVETGGAPVDYNVFYSTSGRQPWNAVVNRTTKTSASDTGLDPGTTRYYRVTARNKEGFSDGIDTPSGTTTDEATRPGDPTSLSATVTGPTTISLSWGPPTDDGGSPITLYEIRIVRNSDAQIAVSTTVEPTVTSYMATGLTPSTQYAIGVAARNSIGFSTSSILATTDAAMRPDAPRNLTATASGQTIINLAWEVPSSDGGAAISGYRVQWSANGTSNWQNVSPAHTGTERSYSDTGLSAGTTRHYRVYARNSVGDSNSPSNTDDATTAAATRPGAPRNLTATASGQTIINLAWDIPSSNGGTAISGYRVQWSANGNSGWTNVSPAHTGTGRSYSDTELSAGTTRHYRVYARNSVGDSTNPSNTDDATTSTPTATRPAAPTGLTATAAGQTTINLSWTAPTNTGGADITGYQIEVSPNGTSNWTNLQANTRLTRTSYSHTGLSAGETRHYRVRAINSVGPGAASNVDDASTDAATRPAAPTGLTATAAGQTTINLSWTAPTNTGGAAITGYRIEVSPNGTSNWTNQQANTRLTRTSYSHTELSAGETRHYRVSAINSVGTGAASNVASATTSTPTITAPAAPTGLTATAAGQTTINLSWTAPTTTGGADITGYQIEVSPNGTTNWTNQQANTGSPATSYSHTGLSAGTTRYYRVSAINSAGTGAASNVDDASTDAATRPAAPTGLTATAAGPTTINLSWTAPTTTGGAAITGYRIEVSPNGTSNWTNLQANTGSPATSYSHTGLSAGTTRYYQISAINSAGTGTASNVASATTSSASTMLSFTSTVKAQRYPVGLAIRDLALPFAIGGMRPYTYTLSPETLPAGLSYDKTARTIGGTPTSVTPAQTFVWTVVDAAAAEVTVEFSLEVYRMTFVAQVNHQSYVQGELIDPLVLPAVTGGEDPIAYTIHPLPLPNGLQYEAGSRTIRGTPTQITPPLELAYTATDANQAQDSLKFNIEVVSSVNTQQETELANQLIVHANYPNPFTHSTRIVFDLPWPAQVQVDIMDMTGRRVYTKPAKNLSSGKKQSVDLYDLALPAGVYLYRMVATSLNSSTSSMHVGQLMSLR